MFTIFACFFSFNSIAMAWHPITMGPNAGRIQVRDKLTVDLDLHPRELRLEPGSIVQKVVSPGRALFINMSEKDVTIRYTMSVAQYLRVEVFDSEGKRVGSELYYKRFSPVKPGTEDCVVVPKGKQLFIANVDAADILRRAKQPPGKYKVVAHYEPPDLPRLASKQITFVLKKAGQ